MKWRLFVLWAVTLVVLGWANVQIVRSERLIARGTPVFLELAPVDPRSLIQGDYMQLSYDLARSVEDRDLPPRGALVVVRDDRNIARFVRPHDPQQPLADGELLLRYHRQNGMIYFGAESFFFQEGNAEQYQNARYGELRVAESGESLLVGLRGPDLEAIDVSGGLQ